MMPLEYGRYLSRGAYRVAKAAAGFSGVTCAVSLSVG